MNKNSFSDDVSKLATVKQATERYKVSRLTLMKYAEKYDAVVRFGRSVRIDVDKFDAGMAGTNKRSELRSCRKNHSSYSDKAFHEGS